jgi:hypothetical protein
MTMAKICVICEFSKQKTRKRKDTLATRMCEICEYYEYGICALNWGEEEKYVTPDTEACEDFLSDGRGAGAEITEDNMEVMENGQKSKTGRAEAALYIAQHFNVSGETVRLILNIFSYIEMLGIPFWDSLVTAHTLFDGTIDIEDYQIRDLLDLLGIRDRD